LFFEAKRNAHEAKNIETKKKQAKLNFWKRNEIETQRKNISKVINPENQEVL
jgi:hypothetical protein